MEEEILIQNINEVSVKRSVEHCNHVIIQFNIFLVHTAKKDLYEKEKLRSEKKNISKQNNQIVIYLYLSSMITVLVSVTPVTGV